MEHGNWIEISVPGHEDFEYYKIKPEKGEKEFIKKQYDAFPNTDLDDFLKKNGITTLVFTGVYASRCVDSIMRTAFSKGYHCILLQDLIGVPDQLLHEYLATLSVCEALFGYVLKSNDLLEIIYY